MPRQARLDAPGTLHHVIVRGIEKRWIVDWYFRGQTAGSCWGRFDTLALIKNPCFFKRFGLIYPCVLK